jgi:hypothetical protein
MLSAASVCSSCPKVDGNFYEDFGLAAQTKKAGSIPKAVTVHARSRSRNEVSN